MSKYIANGLSRQGASSIKNCDNIYMNGIYMDSFTFSRYEKEIIADNENSLFVVCAGHEESDISKEILKDIKEKASGENCDSAQKLIAAAVEVVVMADIKLSQTPGRKLDVGIVVADGNSITAICFGSVGIMVREGGVTSNICFGDAISAVGTGNAAGGTAEPIRRTVADNSRILIYTEEVSEKLSMRDFDGCLLQESSAKCVKSIDSILDTKTHTRPASVLCIDVLPSEAVASAPENDKSAKIFIIAIVIVFLAVVCGAGYFLFGTGGKSQNTSDTVSRINAEQRDKMDLKERVELLNGDFDSIDGYVTKIGEITADRDEKALSVDIRLLNAGAADWEFLANSDEMKALNEAIDKFNEKYKPREEVLKGTDSGDIESRTKAVDGAEEYVSDIDKLFKNVEEKYDAFIGAYNSRNTKAGELEAAKAAQTAQSKTQQQNTTTQKNTQTSTNKQQQTQQKPQSQPQSQPVQQPASKPAQQPASKPAQQPASKPAQQPASKPAQQQTQQKPQSQPAQQPSKNSGGSFGASDKNGSKM